MNKLKAVLIVLTGCMVFAFGSAKDAQAQIIPIGPFTGMYFEGFEADFGQPAFFGQRSVFSGQGQIVNVTGGNNLHITSGWVFNSSTSPHSGNRFMGAIGGGGVRWEFNQDVGRFGGYFTTNSGSTAGANALFYDAADQLLGSLAVQAPFGDSAWAWDGWSFGGATKVRSIEIVGAGQLEYIMHDSMQYDPQPVPEPASMLLFGTGLLGAAIRKKFAV